MDNQYNPFVSVIIPVYNDAEHLKICLESLENQTYPKRLYEVAFIDNASNEAQNIEFVVAKFSQAHTTNETDWEKNRLKLGGSSTKSYFLRKL